MPPEQLTQILELDLFSDFQPLDADLAKAKRQAITFCADMAGPTVPAYWLTLLGPSGTGKTMLAKRIARFFRRHVSDLLDERNRPGEAWTRRGGFKPWIDVVGDMLAGDFSGIRDLKEDWFLVIDDIGAEHVRNKELAVSKLFEILNQRQGLFTVITANLPLEQIHEKLDARIASRLLREGSSVVSFKADTEDYNLRRP